MNDHDEITRERNVQRILAKLQDQLRDRLEDTPASQIGNRACLLRVALMIDELARSQQRQLAKLDDQEPVQ